MQHWRLVKDGEILRVALDTASLRKIFSDIPFKTSAQVTAVAKIERRRMKVGWWLVFLWVAAIPAILAVVEFAGPEWLAGLTLFYAIAGAYIQAMKMLGRWPRSVREKEKQEEELQMQHHHYHCLRNPEGFLRLKIENFERESRERTRR